MNTPKNTSEDNELIRAFNHYYWIVVHTNPILGGIVLLEAPASIKDLISKLQEGYGDVENGILSSLGTNTLLLRLVNKGIPLFKVVGKEISCVADIKKLWDELEIKSSKHDLYFYRKVCSSVMAYLEPQYLQIEKELMVGLEPRKQSIPVSTPQDKPEKQDLKFTYNKQSHTLTFNGNNGKGMKLSKKRAKLFELLKKPRNIRWILKELYSEQIERYEKVIDNKSVSFYSFASKFNKRWRNHFKLNEELELIKCEDEIVSIVQIIDWK